MNSESSIQRTEAFSDGVFAIACTLLIIEIKVPKVEDENPLALLNAILNQWPSFMAFFISFGSILVMWVNHHRSLKLITKTSTTFLFANGFLLLTVTFIPYPTAVLAEYINSPQANSAVMFFSMSYMFSNLGFNLWWQSFLRPEYLFNDSIEKKEINKLTKQTIGGFFIYLATTIIAYWFPVTALCIIFALFILWVGMSIGEKKK